MDTMEQQQQEPAELVTLIVRLAQLKPTQIVYNVLMESFYIKVLV